MSGKTLKKLKNFYKTVKKVFTILAFMVYLYGSVFEVFGKNRKTHLSERISIRRHR